MSVLYYIYIYRRTTFCNGYNILSFHSRVHNFFLQSEGEPTTDCAFLIFNWSLFALLVILLQELASDHIFQQLQNTTRVIFHLFFKTDDR